VATQGRPRHRMPPSSLSAGVIVRGGRRIAVEREILHDGCLKQIWRTSTGEHTRRKRRPVGVQASVCTWVVFCPDHPRKKGNK
jgi:hypothetical protein